MGRPQTLNGKIITLLLPVLQPGETFFSELPPNTVHNYASKAGIKVTTETVILLEQLKDSEPKTSKLTRVTIL